MVGIFISNHPSNNAKLILYGLLLKLPLLIFASKPLETAYDGILYKLFVSLSKNWSPTIFGIIALLLFISQAIWIQRICNQRRLFFKTNYLAGMSYLLLTSLFNSWNVLSSSLIAITILIWIWDALSSLYQERKPMGILFNLGFAVAIASMLFAPLIFLIIIVWIGVFVMRPFKIQEWIMVLFGLMLPYYFYIAFLYLTNKIEQFSFREFGFQVPFFNNPKIDLAAFVLYCIAAVVGIFYLNANFQKQVVQARKIWSLILLLMIILIPISFISWNHYWQIFVMTSFPLAIILSSFFFYSKSKLFTQILHWAMVIVSIVGAYGMIK